MDEALNDDLRIALMRIVRRMRFERADGDISDGHLSAVFVLWKEGAQTLGSLSEHERVTPPSMNRTVNALVEAGLRPEHLTLELTENILMSHIDGAVATLTALRRLGAHLAVDDFGTGYSSLSHLSKLPIDSLKIDRSFVAHLQPGSDDAAVVSAIIQLGGTLRKAVVAEGIESAEQMDQLRDLGCGFGQGFHMALPLSGPETGEWLRAQRGALH